MAIGQARWQHAARRCSGAGFGPYVDRAGGWQAPVALAEWLRGENQPQRAAL